MTLDLVTIRRAARAARITWRYHALLRATQRGITRAQALAVIEAGEIVETRPTARPYPKALLMAQVDAGRSLYVSVAYDGDDDRLYVITVHWLDPRKWEDPWTRKPPGAKRRRTPSP